MCDMLMYCVVTLIDQKKSLKVSKICVCYVTGLIEDQYTVMIAELIYATKQIKNII